MAGLLDYLYDPQSYGGSAGLLSRLMPIANTYQQQSLDTPPGFPPSPSAQQAFAQAAEPQPPLNIIPQQQQAPAQPQQQTLPTFLSGGSMGGVGDHLMAGLQNFANAGGPLQAIAGGISGLASGTRTDPQGMMQQNLRAQYESLVPMLGPQKAMLAVMNPEAGKVLLTEALTNKEEFKTLKDPLGGEHGYFVNPRSQTIKPAEPSGGGGAFSIGSPQVLAPGVSYNPNLTGEDYLNQFGPEVKAAVKAYIRGDVMPSGNPRTQGIANFAKTVAQKYGQDMGIPISDITYTEKRKLRTDLAASGNSSLGGILANGASSFDHLAELGKSMADIGNYSLNGVPFGGAIANGVNYATNSAGDSKRKSLLNATTNNLSRYGQESTKFYAGSGGGVEERTSARKFMDPNTRSSEEMAGYLEKEKSLMMDRLNQKFAQIKQVLGEEEGNREIAKRMPELEKTVASIDASIAKLRGESAKAAAPSALPSGWSVQVR